MADETKIAADENETAELPTEVATPKKRAPRRSRAKMEAAAAKKTAAGRKISVKAAAPPAKLSNSTKADRNGKSIGAESVSSTMSAADEMVELQQLEAENQQLRKALSEKLRTENADLRKRLGL